MQIHMKNNYVMFERTEAKSISDGGIIIPDTAKKMTKTGVVRATDPANETKVGDTIIFNEYNAIAFREDDNADKTQWIMKEEHVMGVIEA